MRFETFEPRIVFDQSLSPGVEIAINHPANAESDLPSNIRFRPTAEDFHYSSENIDPASLDALIMATEAWAEDPIPVYTFPLDTNNLWRKPWYYNPVTVHPNGYIVAERIDGQVDSHSMVVVQKPRGSCHMEAGSYMRPNHHYRFSFDIRHPQTELSWLTTVNGHWSIVTQFWGPDTAGSGLNPPFSILTSVQNGVPYWSIANRGDANAETIRPYDEERFQFVPMENVGQWHSWDIEYVPSHQGTGLVRVWLNGELVADWVDVKSSYLAYLENQIIGPVNPMIGLYSNDVADGQQAHFDNITLQCSGIYESSIAGRITGAGNMEGMIVYATNDATGARYGVTTGETGIYTLELPQGVYSVTAVNQATGYQAVANNVSTFDRRSQVVDLNLSSVSAPPPPVLKTLSGDVTGDGKAEIIHFLEDGSWHVSTVDANGNPSGYVWTTWTTRTTWKDAMLGDFNGDGKQDVIARDTNNGNWWVGISTGASFRDVLWAKWTPTIEWLDVDTGDFNGDGKSDVVGRAATNGSWWVGESTGTGFSNNPWGRWSTAVPWDVVVGDFNGDGLSDIAGRAASDGTLWVGASTGSGFQNTYWGRFSNRVPWSDLMVGDFNADGRSDLVARVPTDGTWWVAESQGDKFFHRFFGRWNTATRWTDLQVADVNGDGRSDVVGRALSGNSWWIGRSTGDIFQDLYWGASWSQNIDWLVAIADDFDGDEQADLLGGSSSRWWLFR